MSSIAVQSYFGSAKEEKPVQSEPQSHPSKPNLATSNDGLSPAKRGRAKKQKSIKGTGERTAAHFPEAKLADQDMACSQSDHG